jgi:hypothetical protein
MQGAALKTWRAPGLDPLQSVGPNSLGSTTPYILKGGRRMGIWPCAWLPTALPHLQHVGLIGFVFNSSPNVLWSRIHPVSASPRLHTTRIFGLQLQFGPTYH